MNQTNTKDPQTDVTGSPRPVNIADADQPNSARDPNFPDIGPDPVANAAQTGDPDARGPLFPEQDLRDLRSRWDQAQSAFVDDPRQAVKKADDLVGTVVQRLADEFTGERNRLEQQWDRGDNVSTEDLRQAIKRYRSFFDRLLNV